MTFPCPHPLPIGRLLVLSWSPAPRRLCPPLFPDSVHTSRPPLPPHFSLLPPVQLGDNVGAESMLEAALVHWQQQQTGARGGAPPAAKGKGAAATAASSAQGGWCLEGLVGLKLKLGKVDEAVRCYQQLQQAGGGGGQRQTAASAGVSSQGRRKGREEGGGESRFQQEDTMKGRICPAVPQCSSSLSPSSRSWVGSSGRWRRLTPRQRC